MLENTRPQPLTKTPRSTFRLLILSILTSCVLLLFIWRPQTPQYSEYVEMLKSIARPSSINSSVQNTATTHPAPPPEPSTTFQPIIVPDVRLPPEPIATSKSRTTIKVEATPVIMPDLSSDEELEPVKHCNDFRTKGDVLLVIKTGATEAYKRLPVHFRTTLLCPQDYLIFSDVEQEFNGVQIHDALDHMKDMVDKNTGEWHFKEALDNVRTSGSPDDYRNMNHGEGWRLDKFKNLPMMLKSYKKYPDKKWYFFIDADTAVIWSNLLTWLSKFNSSRPYYMGSQSMIGDVEFGHGGSGYAVSHAAAKILFEEDPEQKRKHHQYAMSVCCGDMLLSHAFIDNGIHLYRSWPIIQGETPATLDIGDYHWNKPAVTFHHVSSKQIQEIYDFEQHQRLLRERPPTYEDVFEYFVAPKLAEFGGAKDDWDNNWNAGRTITRKTSSSERDKIATRDFEGCKQACRAKWDCLQFTWWKDHCSLDTVMRLGRKREGRRAGWAMGRIEKWKREHANRTTDWMQDWWGHT